MPRDAIDQELAISVGQYSAAGRKPANQDFHGAMIPEGHALALKGVAIAVADGISTSSVSHLAAETAVRSLLSDYYCTPDTWSVKTSGQRVIEAANSWLHAESRRTSDDANSGHVCTLSALVLKGRRAHLFHVGDSRIYRLSGGALEQLTRDHRTVLSPSENYLGRALGLAETIDIDYRCLDLAEGDIFVLTTDGVHEHLPDREMAGLVARADDLERSAQALASLALANGSDDNLTVQLVRIDALPERDAAGALDLAETLPPAPVLAVPSDFEGYRILRQLHAGSRSRIYVAEDGESGRKVALKVPSTDLVAAPALLRRFAMEEWVARRISSPHVLKAAPARRERRSLFVVTELVEGRTLRQWMTDNPAPDLETVRGIVEQVARGLLAFHRREMVHQDLRPENIMIDDDGTVKIIDFGAVRVAGVVEAAPSLEDGEILGTHQYAAPEYFLGYRGTPRSDLFSLGVIAYEMLTGRLPYGSRVARATSQKAQEALQYVPATGLTARVPDWVDAALHRAVHPLPGRRFEALSEFTAALRRPDPALDTQGFVPLAERNPVRFWQGLSALLALVILGMLVL